MSSPASKHALLSKKRKARRLVEVPRQEMLAGDARPYGKRVHSPSPLMKRIQARLDELNETESEPPKRSAGKR